MKKRIFSEQQVFLKKIGLNIREVRLRHGFSQESLALNAGLDRSYMGGVERGERNISVLNLKKIADALGVRVEQLLKECV